MLVNALIYVYNTLLQWYSCVLVINQYTVYLWGTFTLQSIFRSSYKLVEGGQSGWFGQEYTSIKGGLDVQNLDVEASN